MNILNSEIIALLTGGGLQLAVFVIWLFTFKYFTKQNNETMRKLFYNMEQDLKYKELLIGILSRLELKIDLIGKGRERE